MGRESDLFTATLMVFGLFFLQISLSRNSVFRKLWSSACAEAAQLKVAV